MTADAAAIATLTTARQRLTPFSCLQVAPTLTEVERAAVRSALLQLQAYAEYQTLGICAESLAAAKAALLTYVAALAQPIQVDLPAQAGPVYLKFHTRKGAWYLEDYSGTSRGVLITYHGAEPAVDLVNGTYGPLPLDLFS